MLMLSINTFQYYYSSNYCQHTLIEVLAFLLFYFFSQIDKFKFRACIKQGKGFPIKKIAQNRRAFLAQTFPISTNFFYKIEWFLVTQKKRGKGGGKHQSLKRLLDEVFGSWGRRGEGVSVMRFFLSLCLRGAPLPIQFWRDNFFSIRSYVCWVIIE